MNDNNSSRQHISAGTVIFLEGDDGRSGFLIESGTVDVWVEREDRKVSLSHLGEGELLGEMSAIDQAQRSASATALSNCILIEFDHHQIAKRLKTMDPVMRQLIHSLVGRMRNTNAQITNSFGSGDCRVGDLGNFIDIVDQECINKLKWEIDLQSAITTDQFELYFQPIIELASNKLAGFEALIRWNHPELGLVNACDFIPFAEETGLISAITRWCVEKTCTLAAEFQLAALFNPINVEPLFLNVNVSGRNIGNEGFVTWIEDVIARSGCPAEMLKIEITENSVMADMKLAVETLRQLRQLGVGIAIDDFGTGQSNLAYLNQLPISTLKIDQSFVTSRLGNESNRQIVNLILGFAEVLGVSVVAEGIETVDDLEYLLAMKCDFGQGYLFAKPMPLLSSLEFTKSWQAQGCNFDVATDAALS